MVVARERRGGWSQRCQRGSQWHGDEILFGRCRCQRLRNCGERALRQASAVQTQFAAHQIQRLNAVGALVQTQYPGVTNDLFDALLLDVTVSAMHLDGERSEIESGIGAERRSEERRVGKEGVSTCRYRWSPYT